MRNAVKSSRETTPMIKQNQNSTVPTYQRKTKKPHDKKPQNGTPLKNGMPLVENTITTHSELLAQQLRTSEKVTTHPMLRAGNWTKTSYEALATLIKEDLNKSLSPQQRIRLGVSLSSRTLRKIALAEYKITQPADPRTLNTLNKVVIFLGYDHWHHFIRTNALKHPHRKEKDPARAVIEAVKAGVHNRYQACYTLLEKTETLLRNTHIENSPSFNFIMDMVAAKKEEQLVISNRFNPSTCEILDITVKKLETAYAQVYTREYWRLCWWDARKRRYVQRYKNLSEHLYILNNVNGIWKIKTNASTADPMELQ
ncbi:MAG: hypothetical protein AAF934_05415 [Bacteroidota bacterium]